MKPEDFYVAASYDGDRTLECPTCGWYADISHEPKSDRGEIAADLGALLAAASKHIEEHRT